MRPIPSNPVPFNPSLLRYSCSALWIILARTLQDAREEPDSPDAVGAALRAGDIEDYLRGHYGLH